MTGSSGWMDKQPQQITKVALLPGVPTNLPHSSQSDLNSSSDLATFSPLELVPIYFPTLDMSKDGHYHILVMADQVYRGITDLQTDRHPRSVEAICLPFGCPQKIKHIQTKDLVSKARSSKNDATY